ncbi:MAG TPA: PKD domain-containing protein, partial [Flavobacteriales bacterium]|nr:PKD domain-containing protein [Flavobacteriales bacterium]
VNTPVGFTNNSTGGDSHIWEFGDGQFTTEFAPEHTYATPGTYTVTLVVDNGSCTSTWTGQVIVETSTSISGNSAITGVNAWFANDKFVVEHGYNNGQPVTIEVLDATGRLHHTRQAAGTPARVNVPADGLSTGIWFIRIQNDGNTRTVRVPVVR